MQSATGARRQLEQLLELETHSRAIAQGERSLKKQRKLPGRARELEAYLSRLFEKKRRLNERIPVGRLPFELLARVFFFYTLHQKDARVTPYSVLDQGSIFAVTQVCHRWREIAIASPQLWRRIAVDTAYSRAYVETVLARAKNYSFDVKFSCDQTMKDSLQIYKAVFSRIEQIRVLSFAAHVIPWSDVLEKMIPKKAPLLRQLSISCLRLACISAWETCDMPSLRGLSLRTCSLSWTSNLLRPTLTQLSLTQDAFAGRFVSFYDVLNTLEAMTRLRHLELEGGLPSRDHGGQPVSRTVILPSLLRMSLRDSISAMSSLLQCLVLPMSTVIELYCYDEYPETTPEDLFIQVANKFAELFAARAPLKALSVRVSSKRDRCLSIFSSPTVDATQAAGGSQHCPDAVSRSTLSVSIENVDIHPGSLLRAFQLPMLTAFHFTLYHSTPIDIDTWVTTCSSMTNLRELTIGRCGQDTLPLALASHMPTSHPEDAQVYCAPLLPRLQKLHLCDVDPYGRDDDIRAIPVDDYAQALVARRAAGVPLQELILTHRLGMLPSESDKLLKLVRLRLNGVYLSSYDSNFSSEDVEDEVRADEIDSDDASEDESMAKNESARERNSEDDSILVGETAIASTIIRTESERVAEGMGVYSRRELGRT